MKLQHYPVNKLKKDILNIVSKYLDLKECKIFFFGSRVKGQNFDGSDIDIGIEGDQAISPEISIIIKEELEKIPTLYKIDFIDFNQVSDRFKKEALKFSEPIN